MHRDKWLEWALPVCVQATVVRRSQPSCAVCPSWVSVHRSLTAALIAALIRRQAILYSKLNVLSEKVSSINDNWLATNRFTHSVSFCRPRHVQACRQVGTSFTNQSIGQDKLLPCSACPITFCFTTWRIELISFGTIWASLRTLI